jgi:hypothetical protein
VGAVRDSIVVVGAAVAAAATVAIAVPRSTYPSPNAGEPIAPTVSVTARTDDLAAAAMLSLDWSPGRQIRLPDVAGTVTAVQASPANGIECGAPLLQIDGRNLVGYCAAAPLYRTIEPGLDGDDVDQFVDFLVSVELLSTTDPDPHELAAGIDRLRSTIGLDDSGQLAPSDTVWVGPSAPASSIELVVGDVVSGREVVATVDPRLVAARLPEPPPSAAPWSFGLDRSSERHRLGSDGAVIELDALADEVLELAAAGDLPTSAAGSIRLDEPIEVIGVPASAIVSTSTGTCVLAVDGRSASAVEVDVVGASVGVALVAGPLQPGQHVQSRPAADVRC